MATNVGPVISAAAAQAIDAQAADALHRGARDVTPANPSFVSVPQKGSYVAPKILVDVDHSMRVMQDETFGPVIPIAKVATDEEAVLLMNDSTYGLTASVWTKDVDAGQGIAEKLDAGTVFVNRCDYPSPVSCPLLLTSRFMRPWLIAFCWCRIWHGRDGRTQGWAAHSVHVHLMPSSS